MAKFTFNLKPREVPEVNTEHRKINTKIPVPESLSLMEEIKKYESSNALEQLPVVWDRAKNHQIFDEWGNAWIDFTSSIFVTNTGHANEETLKRINECISKPLIHSYYYPTRIRAEFCKKLIEMTPNNLEKAIELSTKDIEEGQIIQSIMYISSSKKLFLGLNCLSFGLKKKLYLELKSFLNVKGTVPRHQFSHVAFVLLLRWKLVVKCKSKFVDRL